MKFTKNNKKAVALIFILVLTLQGVMAFGVTPGRTTIPYDMVDREFFFTVINSEAKDIEIKFSTSGELGEYIILDETEGSMRADEKYRLYRFTLRVEDEFNTVGMYEGKINIQKVPEEGKGFGIGLIVNSQVALKVTESSIILRKDSFSKDEEFASQNITKFNLIILIILIISILVLSFILLNKFIKRK